MPTIEQTDSIVDGPLASKAQILNCAYSSWCDSYKKITPKARIIKPLPKEFIHYLLADGIALPQEDHRWENASSDGNSDDYDEDEDEVEDPTKEFPELHEQIGMLITELGGTVTPKLNWSSPKDATWISSTNDLKCVSPSDIYVLLKASSYISHDLTEAFDSCVDNEKDMPEIEYELVLRKWYDINPSLEFRCFVKDNELIGITQRDMNYYEFLEPKKQKIRRTISNFFEQHLKYTFPDPCFVFDVNVPRSFDRVWLIDINPFASKTDSLLFGWDQLINLHPLEDDFEFQLRLVDSIDSSRGFSSIDHSESRVPKDFVDASISGEGIAELARQWRSALNLQIQEDEEDETGS